MHELQKKLANVIQGRTCCVLAKGKSLSQLEYSIKEYKNKDICWITLNDFEYLEENILSKINKHFDLTSDCATVSNVSVYEPQVRIPRFERYLSRNEKNILTISDLVVQECLLNFQREDLLYTYANKIVTIDSLFSLPQCPPEVWDAPPNSITLLFAFLIAGMAKKIIVFGMDGCLPTFNPLDSYYKSDVVRQERYLAYGDYREGSLKSDAVDFNNRFSDIFKLYKKAFGNPDVEIYNCTTNSLIQAIKKISYNEVKNYL